MKNITALFIMCLLLPVSLAAADFGLVLDQSASAAGIEETAFEYEAVLIPRLVCMFGDSGELYISAGLTAGYNEDGYIVPELLRTEFSWRFGEAKITAGRMQYAAPFAYVAEGLFDGVQFVYDSPVGTFNAGAWYTGLLYKKKANITVTAEDTQNYYADVEYDNFADTYFASRRMVAAVGWEHPSLAELVNARLAFAAQTDLNDRSDFLHSQYFMAKIGIPAGQFMVELGGALELEETGGNSGIGLAGELGIFWTLPVSLVSRLSFTGYFSSGRAADSSLAAFSPITDKSCGDILEAKPSGISALSLDYTARLHNTLSAGLSLSYFIRSDLETYSGYPVDVQSGDEYFLGNEFFARCIWSPVSDLQINLGGGIFLPAMGNVAPDGQPQWRVGLAAILSLY